MYRIPKDWVMVMALLMMACGGGGGGGGSAGAPPVVPSTETFELRTAYENYLKDTRTLTFAFSGTVSGSQVTASGTWVQTAPVPDLFEGLRALRKDRLISIFSSAIGPAQALILQGAVYVDAAYNPMGAAVPDHEYRVVAGGATIPSTARIGDSGTWFIEDRYSDSSKTVRLGSAVTTFVLEADTASTAQLRLTETDLNLQGLQTAITTTRFRITPAGGLSWLQVQLAEGADLYQFDFN